MSEPKRRLLVVEDDAGLQRQMRWCFDDDVDVEVAEDVASAMAAVRRKEPQVVTLDLGLPPDPGGSSEGFRLLEQLREQRPEIKIIVVTGREEHEHAVRAIGLGAYDFYQKPLEAETLQFVVERAFVLRELEEENLRLQSVAGHMPLDGIIAGSDVMLRQCRSVERLAPVDVSVLIRGETGTGKELFARALHRLSPRARNPFVAINCAAIPENLLESELFGYEKGAFTGATAQKKGKVEHADGGTLFLDEIGDMPLALQAKLLRFLQERAVERIGGRQPIPVDIRLVCATHRDLNEMIAQDTFREDLYYRISEVDIVAPPLRERGEDAVLLAHALLKRFAEELRRGAAVHFTSEALQAIEAWEWPGNVREMENRIKRAVVLCDENRITVEDLELEAPEQQESHPFNLRAVRDEAERQAVGRAMAMSNDNITQAARTLGVTRPTLYNLLRKFGMVAPSD
ncbi:MAG: PEP-CTERM-box response regulator transcription factor [Pseudomonadales bacterium]|nr:PEP-CTERM-box response regulator transcription factor [Pseudomonadales bacterium]